MKNPMTVYVPLLGFTGPYPRVVRPAAQGAVQLLHQLRGLAPVHPATAEAIAGLSLRFRV